MKVLCYGLLVLSLLGCDSPPVQDDYDAKVRVRFSPHGGCTDQIVSAIDKAEKKIYVQAYSFTSVRIGEALLRQKQKGREVAIILDHSNEKDPNSLVHLMLEGGVHLFIDSAHQIAHSKLILIDGEIVLSGSFNFTKAAEEKNAENCIWMRSRKMGIAYEDSWHQHREHSRQF